jgi:primosomal protein N' (replication factor Y)
MALLHSNLNDSERLCNWAMARSGAAKVVIGTRSAIFTPLPAAGLVIIDEEHDGSLKQQEGFRYHARDLAVMRAQNLGIPVIMGSATPSLESLARCSAGAYQQLKLGYRAGAGTQPALNLIDMRRIPHSQGLSETLVKTMHQHLKEDGQILLFLNRRGFAPTLLCEDCGWIAQCQRCDARMTWHEGKHLLRCHHCGAEQRRPQSCPECSSENLYLLGEGTERIEQELEAQFPDIPLERFDRDSVRRKGSLEKRLSRVQSGESRIIIGTQMLAKGHDFPGVTLVGILDSDQGLFSADFRAAERMAQLITQVAGRAGRGARRGEVMIQTHHPEHPLLQALIHNGFEAFSQELLNERRAAGLPPFAHLALLRVEAQNRDAPPAFIEHTMAALGAVEDVIMLGPVPALMERRAGRFRYQLLFSAEQRPPLHRILKRLTDQLSADPEARKVRWSLDVDPVDLY